MIENEMSAKQKRGRAYAVLSSSDISPMKVAWKLEDFLVLWVITYYFHRNTTPRDDYVAS